jgi:hypothetical protein
VTGQLIGDRTLYGEKKGVIIIIVDVLLSPLSFFIHSYHRDLLFSLLSVFLSNSFSHSYPVPPSGSSELQVVVWRKTLKEQ